MPVTKVLPLGNGQGVAVQYDDNGKLIGSGGKAIPPLSGAQAIQGTTVSQAPAQPSNRSSLMGAQKLAQLYGGINFDEDAILRKFNAATRGQFDALRKEYGNVENQFYNQLSSTQDIALDTIRKNNAAAIATGASRGMQSANELSAMLGLQQESAMTATELAQQSQQLADKEAAALAENPMKALEMANAEKSKLAGLSANLYGQDTMFDIGAMSSAAEMEKAKAQVESAGISADAQIKVQGLMNDYNLTRLEAEKLWKIMDAETTKYGYDKQLEGTKYNVDNSPKYYSNSGYTGGNTGGNTTTPTPVQQDEVQALMKKFGLTEDVALGIINNNAVNSATQGMYDKSWGAGSRDDAIKSLMAKDNRLTWEDANAMLNQDDNFLMNEATTKYGVRPVGIKSNKELYSLNDKALSYTGYSAGDIVLNRDTGTLYRIGTKDGKTRYGTFTLVDVVPY